MYNIDPHKPNKLTLAIKSGWKQILRKMFDVFTDSLQFLHYSNDVELVTSAVIMR